ncbi:DUF1003 domain-containing protein [Lactococcus petauri]|uniref:DUF1003 domain-containing protein n=1 Tax=Lactococcus petauri TaxID=1940789 RepID=UPI003854714B
MNNTYIDLVTKKVHSLDEGLLVNELDESLKALIKDDFPYLSGDNFISQKSLVNYRKKRINQMITQDNKVNAKMDRRFKKFHNSGDYQEVDVQASLDKTKTIGTRLADVVSNFGGSWTFILVFLSILILWIIVNTIHLFGLHFDPYPFILLNLALSMIAAIQAPIIMMSQNRSATYDRLSSKNDYNINKKSELEIRLLHSKLDHLIQKDQPINMEIQKIQTDLLIDMDVRLEKIEQQLK